MMQLTKQTPAQRRRHLLDAIFPMLWIAPKSPSTMITAVANAGLLLTATLAMRLGLEALVDDMVDLGQRPGAPIRDARS